MDKYNELFEEILDLIVWAEEQKHINYNQKELLLDKINEIKESLDKE